MYADGLSVLKTYHNLMFPKKCKAALKFRCCMVQQVKFKLSKTTTVAIILTDARFLLFSIFPGLIFFSTSF